MTEATAIPVNLFQNDRELMVVAPMPGVAPEDISTLEDLQKLPMLTKAALRENLKRRKAQARGRESATESGEDEPSGPPLPPKEPAE